MNGQQSSISEEEVHAYVDGALSDSRRVQVERMLEQQPELAARVNDYFALNNLFHERHDRVLNEPVPTRLKSNLARRWRDALNWPQYAAMAASLVLGVGIGVGTHMGADITGQWVSNTEYRNFNARGPEGFAREAAVAHVVYMPAIVRPVDIGEDHEEDFVRWLSSRLGADVHPPVLTKSGFELTGGRMLAGPDGQTAMFMYRDAKGERMTLSVSRRKLSSNTTAFKLYQDGPVSVFYWVDGDFGYAVSGGIDRKLLLQLSHECHSIKAQSTVARNRKSMFL